MSKTKLRSGLAVAVRRLVRLVYFWRLESGRSSAGLLCFKLGIGVILQFFVALFYPIVKRVARIIGHDLSPNPSDHIFPILNALCQLLLKIRYRLRVFFLELGYRFRLCKIFWGFDNRYDDRCRLRDNRRKNPHYCRARNFRTAHQYVKARAYRRHVAEKECVCDVVFKSRHAGSIFMPNDTANPPTDNQQQNLKL